MGSRKVHDLSGNDIAALPSQCRQCLFWELGAPRPNARDVGKVHEDELAGDPLTSKAAWASGQLHEHGAPGRVIEVDGKTAGYVLFGPPTAFPARVAPVPGLSDDCLFLATIWVEPQYRRHGLGRVLIQASLKEAIHRDLRAVETYGDRRFREADCTLPSMWLLHEGFEVEQEHPRYPLLRIDVKRTARWAESLEGMLDDVLERVRRGAPSPMPAPAPVRTMTQRGTDQPDGGRQ